MRSSIEPRHASPPSGGAKAAGVVAGDAIVSVAGETVVSLGFERAVETIRGPVGTSVALELRRTDASLELVCVERRVIRARRDP